MKVALVNRRFTEQGGTERFLVGLARYMRAQGHVVHVYCNEVRGDLQQEEGMVFHRLPLLRPVKNLSLWHASAGIEADVVMAFGRCRDHDVLRAGGGAHAAWQSACRRGWILDPSEWMERFLDRDTALRARRVITPSARAGEDLIRCYGLPRERLRVVHNGVDCERFCPGPGGKGLVFLGSGFERKGLVEAIAVAERLDLPLTVLGSDRRLERWKLRYPRAHFLGAVERPEDHLPHYDALLLPSRYEPFGNACLEALACGTSPVTSSVNGATEVLPPELVGDGVDALVEATRWALDGGAPLRARCRALALAMPRERAYQAVEQILRESRR